MKGAYMDMISMTRLHEWVNKDPSFRGYEIKFAGYSGGNYLVRLIKKRGGVRATYFHPGDSMIAAICRALISAEVRGCWHKMDSLRGKRFEREFS